MNTKAKDENNPQRFVPVLTTYLSFAFYTNQCGTMWEHHDMITKVLPQWLFICQRNPGTLYSWSSGDIEIGVGQYCSKSRIFTVEHQGVIFRFKDNRSLDLEDRQSQAFSRAFICLLCEELADKTFGQLLDDGKNANSLEANYIAYNILMKAIELEQTGNDAGHVAVKSRSGELSIYISDVSNTGFTTLINHTRLGCNAKIVLGQNFPCITNLQQYSQLAHVELTDFSN